MQLNDLCCCLLDWFYCYILSYVQIRHKVSLNGQVSSRIGRVTSHIPALEKLDLERIKVQREVSFADQIKAAKHKKAELLTTEALQREVSFADQIKPQITKKQTLSLEKLLKPHP